MCDGTEGTRNGESAAGLTSFVGRRGELAAVKRLLAYSRLVTLTGAGRAGKIRLALRTTAELRQAFSRGVWLSGWISCGMRHRRRLGNCRWPT
jgi:hypothetical protein